MKCRACKVELGETKSKLCKKCYLKDWRKKNKKHIKDYALMRYERDQDKIKEYKIKWKKKNPEYEKEYYENNKKGLRNYKKEWRSENKNKVLNHVEKYIRNNPGRIKYLHDRTYFDGQRVKALERDNFTCQRCGMTEEKHLEKWGCSLIIHHKDGKGWGKKNKNNSLGNLQTLCKKCHGKEHGRPNKISHLTVKDKSQ